MNISGKMRGWLATIALMVLAQIGFAQNGVLSGTVTNADTKEPLFGATVAAYQGDRIIGGASTDFDGKFRISPLPPGEYRVEVSSFGFQKKILTGVNILADKTARRNISLAEQTDVLEEVVIQEDRQLIGADAPSAVLSSEDLSKLGFRDVNQAIATTANVFAGDDGDALNIKGMSSEFNITFVNGVRVRGPLPPVEAIEQIEVIDGGVSARYGDALGGVINITTKRAAADFRGGIQLETSRPFDQWNYDLVSANLTGPIYKKKEYTDPEDSTKFRERTIVDFFALAQYTHYRDRDPSATGYWIAKEEALDRWAETPLIPVESETGLQTNYVPVYSQSEFVSPDDFENVEFNPNSHSHEIQTNFTVGFAPVENILISVGGNGQLSQFDNSGVSTAGSAMDKRNFFNYENRSRRQAFEGNAFVRFLQEFPTDTSSLLQNVYYQVQFDYLKRLIRVWDPRFEDKPGLYNHVGSFENLPSDVALLSGDSAVIFDINERVNSNGEVVVDTNEITLLSDPSTTYILEDRDLAGNGWRFNPSDINPEMANVTNYLLNDLGVSDEYTLPVLGGLVGQQYNAAVNGLGYGSDPSNIFDLNSGYATNPISGFIGFAPERPGAIASNYTLIDDEQYRFTLQASGELGSHSLKAGLEFEQRVEASYTISEVPSLFAEALVNNHITADWNQPGIYTFDTSATGDTITVKRTNTFTRNSDGSIQGQTDFDRNLRARLGISDRPDSLLNIADSRILDPNELALENFSPNELFFNGLFPVASYRGYDIYGNRQRGANRSDWRDFFTDTLNRPIPAFRPIYMAGYIEDKFEVQDVIIRAGLRVDFYDANQPVLKDKYSFVDHTKTGDLSAEDWASFSNGYEGGAPGSVGDDYAIYVAQDPSDFNGSNYEAFRVTGFRSGETWYDANGVEVDNAQIISQASGGQFLILHQRPAEDDRISSLNYEISRIELDAFEDYRRQINLLPRLSVTFPVNEVNGRESLFFAHYDVLTQRPAAYFPRGGIGAANAVGDPFGDPLQYFQLNIAGNNEFLVNPNLAPQRKIDYQVGFQQALSKNFALRMKAFYSEIRDLIQVVNVQGAYPRSYRTNENEDFGTVKGFSLQLDMLRVGAVKFNASYTLQFAEGSGSDFAANLVNTGVSTVKTVYPLNFDQRHALKLNVDLRVTKSVEKSLPGLARKILKNSGLNMTFFTGSGTPYTALGGAPGVENSYTITGAINGNRLPWTNRSSLRIDKTFFPISKKSTNSDGETTRRTDESKSLNVYLYVTNLFNAQNILNVYPHTGEPDDDGYLNSPIGQNELAANAIDDELEAFYYRLFLQNPDNISLPRWFRIGAQFNF